MNIQPSVMIWTVICFILLMLILKNLLFTPVLKVIDSRKEKIEAARKKKQLIDELTAENEERLAKEKILAAQEQEVQTKSKIQQIQLQGKKDIQAAQRQRLSDVNEYRENISEEYDKIVHSVAPEMETAASIFAKNIISHRV